MPQKSYLTPQEQLTRGIEQLALGWNFITNPKNEKRKISADAILSILEEAYNDLSASGDDETDFLNRRYKNYREKLEEPPFFIKIDFQKKILQNFKGNDEIIKKFAKIYLEMYAEDYNEIIVENYFKIQKQNGLLEYALFLIVFFNLSARLGLKVDLTYDNIMHSFKKRRRKIQPIGLSCRLPYLNLIALDLDTKTYKHFVLSCITDVHTDIFDFYKDPERKRINLDLKSFRDSKDYRYEMDYVTFRIQLNKKFLRHFQHVYFPEFEIISEGQETVILDVSTWDYRYFYNAIFNYRNHCRILSPEDKIKSFKEFLQKTLKVYEY